MMWKCISLFIFCSIFLSKQPMFYFFIHLKLIKQVDEQVNISPSHMFKHSINGETLEQHVPLSFTSGISTEGGIDNVKILHMLCLRKALNFPICWFRVCILGCSKSYEEFAWRYPFCAKKLKWKCKKVKNGWNSPNVSCKRWHVWLTSSLPAVI